MEEVDTRELREALRKWVIKQDLERKCLTVNFQISPAGHSISITENSMLLCELLAQQSMRRVGIQRVLRTRMRRILLGKYDNCIDIITVKTFLEEETAQSLLSLDDFGRSSLRALNAVLEYYDFPRVTGTR